MDNVFQNIIQNICDELSINFKLLSKDWVIMLQSNNVIKCIVGYKFDLNSHALGLILDDKYALYDVLKENNIKVIEHSIVYGVNNHNTYAESYNNMDYLTNLFNKYNKDIVLKINNGTCGINVERICCLEELQEKYLKMATKNNSLSCCPYYEIDYEYRVIVLENEIKLVYKKERPIVIGDGISTIKELLIHFNPTYFKDINDEHLDIVLDKGKKYFYDWKFNLSRGARMSKDIEGIDLENVSKLASLVSETLGIGFASIDIIKSKNAYYVLEINSGVMMNNYIKQAENGYHDAYKIYKEAIMKMFKG